jgi:1,4-dihydroxy-2-naphthoate octaprenyltransferase
MDKDETPIGGLQHPLQPTMQLLQTSIMMDLLAISFSVFISIPFFLGIFIYIAASKAYSYRGIRLKKFPVLGFLTVFIFQGALIFFISYHACHPQLSLDVPLLPLFISSFLIGSLYPLTQIYQHEEDKKDHVKTLSIALGKRGTFIFCILLFLGAVICIYLMFYRQQSINLFVLYLLINIPVVSFFFYWMYKVWMDEKNADFRNSLLMNTIATLCSTLFFTLLIINKY